MSEVHRYDVVIMLSEAGGRISYDPHGPEIVMARDFDRVTAERDAALETVTLKNRDVLEAQTAVTGWARKYDALQERLNAADQRADDLQFQLNDREGSRRDWFDEAQRLQAQLAYAVDALNEVVAASAMYEKPFEIATLAIGELSASAEPTCDRCEGKGNFLILGARPKCGNCGSSNGKSCNDKGCGYLEADICAALNPTAEGALKPAEGGGDEAV